MSDVGRSKLAARADAAKGVLRSGSRVIGAPAGAGSVGEAPVPALIGRSDLPAQPIEIRTSEAANVLRANKPFKGQALFPEGWDSFERPDLVGSRQ